MSVVVVCLGLGLAIALHEAAHLLAARLFGIAVTDAFWGFGPKLWSKQIGETIYGIRWLPVGGYVKLGGHRNTAWRDGTAIPAHRLLETTARWKRTIVVLAGVAANLLLAFAVIWGLLIVAGKPQPTTTVDRVVADSAAHMAGLQVGDRLVAVGDRPIVEWADLGKAVIHRGGQPVTVVVERNNRLQVFPNVTLGFLDTVGFLGVGPVVASRSVGPVEGFASAVGATMRGLVATTEGLLRLFNPSYIWRQIRGDPDQVDSTRPVSLVGVVAASSNAAVSDAWLLVASLNLSVAVLNVLPFPPFDGGHVTMMLLERLRRRQVGKMVFAATGMVMVAWVMFVVVALIVLDVTAPTRI